MDQQIVDFLVEHSPPDSGWIYQAVAKNWDLVQQATIGLLVFIVVCMLALAVNFWTVWDDR